MKLVILWVAMLFLVFANSVNGEKDNESLMKMNEATEIISELPQIAEKKIIPALFRNAYGIAIIPDVTKVALLVGGRYGKGFVSLRQNDGSWTEPFVVTLSGGSFGWQIGAQSTDMVLVFKSSKSLAKLKSGKLTLGLDAAVAAGPVGRHVEIATDPAFEAEIYSYALCRGLFAGISLAGVYLKPDIEATEGLYNASYEKIEQGQTGAPVAVKLFLQTLARRMAIKNE